MSSTTRRRSTSNAPSGSPAVSPSRNFPCECGREYKHRQSLFTHRKKCTFLLNGGGGEGERPPRSPIPNPRTPRTPARTPRSPARSRAPRSRRHAEGPAQGGDKRLFLKRNLPSLLFLSFVAFAYENFLEFEALSPHFKAWFFFDLDHYVGWCIHEAYLKYTSSMVWSC